MSQPFRIGVICEGLTDFHAIEQFFGQALEEKGFPSQFLDLQPLKDATLPDGGWGGVESWLRRYPPEIRVKRHFGGGFFDGPFDAQVCDILLIQLDTDVLDDSGFRTFQKNSYGQDIKDAIAHPEERAEAIRATIEEWAQIRVLCKADADRHLLAPAVESTETWCVAAFKKSPVDLERLRGQELATAFMDALLRAEGRPSDNNCVQVDKSIQRREAFCKQQRNGAARAIQCRHFEIALNGLIKLATAFSSELAEAKEMRPLF